jgi:hypothetical protein
VDGETVFPVVYDSYTATVVFLCYMDRLQERSQEVESLMECMTCKYDGPDYCLRGCLRNKAKCRYYEQRKLYLCGKITGDTNYRAKFLDAENKLHEAGFYPVNPAACIPSNKDWNHAMRTAIRLMLQCDGVALLPDWKQSKGAKIEERLARELGIEVKAGKEWLYEAE